jgi:Zn-dependent oligopeptidase
LVYAKDMFRTKFINHELDLAVGELYKKEILSYGGSRPSIESLKKFLGREPSSDAFFESF